jgi:hypothetical protein
VAQTLLSAGPALLPAPGKPLDLLHFELQISAGGAGVFACHAQAPLPAQEDSASFICENGCVKTTIELPDPIFRRAKAAAAAQGKSLKVFFTEAVQQRLTAASNSPAGPKRWEKAFGGLRDLHRENLRIARLIEAEFETIDQEQWR